MKKQHELTLDLGDVQKAIITFNSEELTTSIPYPQIKTVALSEGTYDITVQAYQNSSITFPEVNRQECVDVPESGVGGLIGLETERCFTINIPETTSTSAVIGGGKQTDFFYEEQLESATEMNINLPLFGKPTNIEQLQNNLERLEREELIITFE
jgi:hypothetical protein